jgi:poly(A) polymerase
VAIARRLRAAGHEALLCGGAVRDRLLGRSPADYDVATSAPPEEGRRIFPEAVPVGARFGVLVLPRPGGPVELATFRDDGLYVDGRRPSGVRYSTPSRDAQRRDFTVNGLFEDPDSGAIQDHVGGRADLRARLVRAIGDPRARFREDHLRILRAVRFAVQLGFAVAPGTWSAVCDLAPLVDDVARERVRDELLRILRHGRGAGLRLLHAAGLLERVLPEVAAMRGVPQPPAFHPEGDVFVHTCLVLDALHLPVGCAPGGPEERDLLLACLLHDVGKPPTRSTDPDGRVRFNGHDRVGRDLAAAILERLRLPRRCVERVQELVQDHIRIASTPRMRPHRLRRFLGREDVELHLALHAADCAGSHGSTEILTFCRESLAAWAGEPILPPPLLRGQDLLAMGYAPGPRMGRILRWLRNEQLDGRVADRAEAVRCVRETFPPADGEASRA